MKKIFKRNQVIISVLAIMIAVAGYINYISNMNRNTTEANASVGDSNGEFVDIFSNDSDVDSEVSDVAADAGGEIEPDATSLMEPGTAIMTSTDITGAGSTMISEVKLNREQVRAANKETLLQIIDNTTLDEASKQAAINEMIEMTEISEKEMAAELLLEAKGYGDCIVTIVDDGVDIVVNMAELTDVQRAQIEDIVKRKTDCEADKIVISPINNLQ